MIRKDIQMKKGECLIRRHRRGAEERLSGYAREQKKTSKGLVCSGNEFRFYFERREFNSKILNKWVTYSACSFPTNW